MRTALGWFGAVGVVVACNGAVGDVGASNVGPTAADAGTDAASTPADPTDCVESTASGTAGGASRTHLRLDTDARVISLLLDDGTRVLGWRYDEEKRLVAYAGFRRPQGSQWDEFQHDRKYDSHGNETDFRASYPSAANLDRPSDATATSSEHYDNVYDANGTLISSTLTTYGSNGSVGDTTSIAFHENPAQQCDRIETDARTTSVETRVYDAQGRLSRADRTGGVAAFNCSSSTWTSIWTYDDRGRTTQLRQWCSGAAPASEPDRVTTTTYRADGTERVELTDRTSDLPSEYPQVTERSAYCAVIDTWRGGTPRDTHQAGTRCRL